MANLFDNTRSYILGDAELDLLGDRDKLAQWRHKGMGPAFSIAVQVLLQMVEGLRGG